MVSITDSAAEKIKSLGSQPLRIKVVGGGCSGLQYKMELDTAKETDKTFEHNGAIILIDKKSFLYLKDSTIDYKDSLVNAGFQIQNPMVKHTCGCGVSFTV